MLLRFGRAGKINFDSIKDGSKTIETRLASPRYRNLAPGQPLVLCYGAWTVRKIIKKVERFNDVDEMTAALGFKQIMPYVSSVAEMKETYSQYPGYDEAGIAQSGLLAIHI